MSWRRSLTVPHSGCLSEARHTAVQAAGCADIKSVFTNLLDGADSSQWQKEAKMIWKIPCKRRQYGFAAGQVFGLKIIAIGGEDELGFLAVRWLGCFSASPAFSALHRRRKPPCECCFAEELRLQYHSCSYCRFLRV
jgi:hypothetical protein